MFKNVIKKLLQLSLLILLVACSIGRSTIQEIDTLIDPRVQEALRTVDDQTLVVFDVDGTLTNDPDEEYSLFHYIIDKPEDAAEEDAAFVGEAKAKYEAYRKEKGNDYVDDLVESAGLLRGKDRLIEPEIITDVLSKLRSSRARVVALTLIPSGAFGTAPCGRSLRFEKLQKLGIDFSVAFPQEQITFDTLKTYNDDYPMFYKGILFANFNNEKGKILGEFFDRIGWRPSKVLFFDDRRKHVESVEQEMNRRSIPVQGYWYRFLEKLQHPKRPLDREIARVQLQHLLGHDEYLLIDEAAAIVLEAHSGDSSSTVLSQPSEAKQPTL